MCAKETGGAESRSLPEDSPTSSPDVTNLEKSRPGFPSLSDQVTGATYLQECRPRWSLALPCP